MLYNWELSCDSNRFKLGESCLAHFFIAPSVARSDVQSPVVDPFRLSPLLHTSSHHPSHNLFRFSLPPIFRARNFPCRSPVFLFSRFCIPRWQSLQVLRYIEGLGRAVDFQLLYVILKTELRVKWAGFKLWKKRLYSHCKDARQSPHFFFFFLPAFQQ